MKRFIVFLLAALLAVPSIAAAVNYDYVAAVYRSEANTRGGMDMTEVTSGITYKVLTASSNTAATLTVIGSSTSKTNPITTTVFAVDDSIIFRTTAATVDLMVTDTVGGFSTVIRGFSPNDHSVILDERIGVKHHGVIPFTCTAGTTTETDTGIDFNYDSRIENVTAEVITAGSAGDTLNIGLLSTESSGDVDGFIINWDTTRAGYLAMTITSSGALLDNGTVYNAGGHYIESANARSLVYQCAVATGSAAGYIHYDVTELR